MKMGKFMLFLLILISFKLNSNSVLDEFEELALVQNKAPQSNSQVLGFGNPARTEGWVLHN